jgi:hypothetical protein
MADVATPTALLPVPGAIQGRAPQTYIGVAPLAAPGKVLSDLRNFRPPTGTISDVVVLKSGATETPFVNGRVWLLRAADGWKAWEGWTDAAGAYTATGLELGVEYIAVGIDPLRNHKTTGAGPVLAT